MNQAFVVGITECMLIVPISSAFEMFSSPSYGPFQ